MRLLFVFTGLFLTTAGPAMAAAPSRVVSTNLCTDELLEALADPDQIAALSPYAVDAAMTIFAERARTFRHNARDAESVIDLKPDLVVGGRFSNTATREILRRLDYRVAEFDVATSIADSVSQIRRMAALLGHPERGEALVAEISAAEGRAKAATANRKALSAAFYQRRGYVTGGQTLTGELMGLVGLANAGSTLAGATGGIVPLERLVATRPDLLIVDSPATSPEDQGSALLAHPALAGLYPETKRILLPERLTVCGGPSLPQALDWLSAQVERVTENPGR
jgi:iron complex transport system substrate-binding protein